MPFFLYPYSKNDRNVLSYTYPLRGVSLKSKGYKKIKNFSTHINKPVQIYPQILHSLTVYNNHHSFPLTHNK